MAGGRGFVYSVRSVFWLVVWVGLGTAVLSTVTNVGRNMVTEKLGDGRATCVPAKSEIWRLLVHNDVGGCVVDMTNNGKRFQLWLLVLGGLLAAVLLSAIIAAWTPRSTGSIVVDLFKFGGLLLLLTIVAATAIAVVVVYALFIAMMFVVGLVVVAGASSSK